MRPLIWSASFANSRPRPSAAEAAFWLGESRFYNRQYRPALLAYQQVPPGSPRYPDALYGRGWVYYQGSDWPKAAAEFEQVVQRFPEASIRPEALFRLGEVQFNLKELREGDCRVSATAARVSSGEVGAQCPLAHRLGTLQGWQQRPGYSRVVRAWYAISPNQPIAAEAHYWLGMAYLSTKQLDEARAQFERILAQWPSSEVGSQAILRLGDTYYNQGKFTQAIDTYTRLTASGTADVHTLDAEYGIILALYQLRRLNEYATRAKAFIARYPTNPLSVTVLYQLAELYEAENRSQLALDTLQEVITRFGQSELVESAHLRRAEIFARQGNWQASLTEAQQALTMAKSDVVKSDALYTMAQAQQELKLYPAAAESYRRLIQNYPKSRFVACWPAGPGAEPDAGRA